VAEPFAAGSPVGLVAVLAVDQSPLSLHSAVARLPLVVDLAVVEAEVASVEDAAVDSGAEAASAVDAEEGLRIDRVIADTEDVDQLEGDLVGRHLVAKVDLAGHPADPAASAGATITDLLGEGVVTGTSLVSTSIRSRADNVRSGAVELGMAVADSKVHQMASARVRTTRRWDTVGRVGRRMVGMEALQVVLAVMVPGPAGQWTVLVGSSEDRRVRAAQVGTTTATPSVPGIRSTRRGQPYFR
jgi:hypothetical protein